MKIENKLLSIILGRVDFLIRFIYCHLSFLSKTICRKQYLSDRNVADRNHQVMMDILTEDFQFENKLCMELGPGDSLVSASHILDAGARKVVLVDKFPRMKLASDSQYDFVEGDIISLEFDEQFDFVYSLYVLEHVKSLKETIGAIADLTKLGGISYHAVGLMDHYNLNDPFLFYKYPKYIWEKFLTKEGISYTNRLRHDDYLEIFKEVGFEVIGEQKNIVDLNSNVKLSKFFKSKDKESLSVIGVNFLLKKVR